MKFQIFFTIIINQCLETRVFSNCLKLAKVKPTYIGKETIAASIIAMYIPILLLPTISKNVAMFTQLYYYSILILCYQNSNTVLNHSIQRNEPA